MEIDMKKIVLIILLLTAYPFAHGQDLSQIYVRIGTGDDDLRGGSELTLTINRKDGANIKIPLIQGRRLGDRTVTSRVYAVEPRLPLVNLTSASISWTPGRCDAPCQTDQWWMTEFTLRVGAGPEDPTFKQAIENASFASSVSGRITTLSVSEDRITLPHKFEDRDQTINLFSASAVRMCQNDSECSDGLFCNGVERCQPSNAAADARGCLVSSAPACASGSCNEAGNRCEQACVDSDGDGHQSNACGGDDCDDNDAARFPGNVEVFGDNDKDQDCNPDTHGYFSSTANSRQICDGRDKVVIAQLRDGGEVFTRGTCAPGTVCVTQPNGEGICMTEPPGYQAPAAAVLPSGPQQMPRPPLSQNPNVRKHLLDVPVQLPGNSKNNDSGKK